MASRASRKRASAVTGSRSSARAMPAPAAPASARPSASASGGGRRRIGNYLRKFIGSRADAAPFAGGGGEGGGEDAAGDEVLGAPRGELARPRGGAGSRSALGSVGSGPIVRPAIPIGDQAL